MAKKASPSTALTNWEEKLAAEAADVAALEPMSSGSFISTRGGILSFGGNPVEGNVLEVVVLDHVLENHYYTERYDADNPAPPACFAFGRKEADMAPHANAEAAVCESCKDCPMNEFGSADTGRGKACKNIRRLALIMADEDSMGDVANAQIAFLKIPVTSVKGWSTYVNQIATSYKRPPFAVVTQIGIVPDPKSQFKLTFKFVDKIENGATIEALIARRPEMDKALMVPYSSAAEMAERNPRQSPAKGRTPARGKAAPAGKAAPVGKRKF